MAALSTTTSDILAGDALLGFLAGRSLPPYLPLEPSRLAASFAAQREAPEFLDTLADLYGVDRWTFHQLSRAFFRGAIATARPGTLVRETASGLRVLSPGCPIASEVERDPRVCQFCQSFHAETIRAALPGRVETVEFDQLTAKGDGVCEMHVRLRPGAAL